ncbi:acyl-CoA thioesterase [Paenibacillus sp. CN-4]|uniref:acyl-CoA thioesterase n=1 Tax=Paenibacillus nanchangensis TaxID=3348343 RepID=UPI00397C84E1
MSTSQNNLPSRWFVTMFRVRYQETDKMGVVYHANYLNWFEIGRTEMLRSLGFTYREMEEQGVLLPVTNAAVDFKSPARYDDNIAVYTRMTSFTPLRIGYEYEIRRREPGAADAAQSTSEDAVQSASEDAVQSTSEDAAQSASADGALQEQARVRETLLVSGTTSHVWVNGEWKPARLDRHAPERYAAIVKALSQKEEADR